MNTIYRKPIPSPMHPYQVAKNMTFDVQNSQHPVRQEIQGSLGEFKLTATFEEDTQTLALFKHVPGLIAFICTLTNTKNGSILGQGRGTTVLSKINRYIDRSVAIARNASLIDAVVRATKAMEALNLDTDEQKGETTPTIDTAESKAANYTGLELPESFNEKPVAQGITAKQKEYLKKLVATNIKSELERDRWLSELHNLSSQEASRAIQQFKK